MFKAEAEPQQQPSAAGRAVTGTAGCATKGLLRAPGDERRCGSVTSSAAQRSTRFQVPLHGVMKLKTPLIYLCFADG